MLIKNLEKMLVEIERALEYNLHLAALTMTLILPDICSKIEYPHIKKTGERYIMWLKDRIDIDYPINRKSTLIDETGSPVSFEFFTSEKIYSLRNTLLHETKSQYESGDQKIIFDIISDNDEKYISCSSILACGDGEKSMVYKHIRVNVHDLCVRILCHAKTYIQEK